MVIKASKERDECTARKQCSPSASGREFFNHAPVELRVPLHSIAGLQTIAFKNSLSESPRHPGPVFRLSLFKLRLNACCHSSSSSGTPHRINAPRCRTKKPRRIENRVTRFHPDRVTGLSCFPRQEPRKYTGQRSRLLRLCRIYHAGCSNSGEKVGVCRCQELRLKQTDFFDTSFEAGRREQRSLFQRDDLPAAPLILHHGNNILVKAQAAPMDDESVDSKFNDQTPGIRNRGGGVKSTLNRKT